MNVICKQCTKNFEVLDEDLEFYEKVSPIFAGKKYLIPPPRLCPECRHQRRLAFRNERKLYTRKSDMSGKSIITIYSPDKPYKVYDQDEWWGDKWDAMEYGRDFDFQRDFAGQFRELYEAVPRVSLHTIGNENSYYSCYTLYLKNCYLLFGASYNEDCMYGKFVVSCKDCLDLLAVYSCEMCYQGVASEGCYNCKFFTNCRSCVDCLMTEDCSSCKNCIACFGLRSKEYCFLNEFVGREKFEQIAKEYEYLTHGKILELREKLAGLKAKLPHVQSHIYASENCSGDALYNCKNCDSCFDLKGSEDCKFLHNSPKSIWSQDGVYTAPDGLQFCYNVCSTVGSNLIATYFVWYCDRVYYCMDCLNCTNLFGCVGLRNKHYCIFNKQYSREEYEVLAGRIVEHMGMSAEDDEMRFGEFFPYKLAPCCYNETVANEYFPLEREEVLKIGAMWYEDNGSDVVSGMNSPASAMDLGLDADIREVSDDILQKTLVCEASGRKYKITAPELKFYRKMKLPIPLKCPDERHYDRLKLHGSYKVFDRQCAKCRASIKSIYDSGRPEIVYCEKCYLAEVY